MKYSIEYIEKYLMRISESSNQEIVDEYVEKLPRILYRFRPGNEHDIDALNEEYLWITKASNFKDDPFDSTINFDYKRQIDKVQKVIRNLLPSYALYEYSKYLARMKKESSFPVDESFVERIYNVIEETGELDSKKLRSILLTTGATSGEVNELLRILIKLFTEERINALKENYLTQIRRINHKSRENIWVCSLTTSYKNEKMWELYANRSSGFCIKYDLSGYINKSESIKNTLGCIFPIFYSKPPEFDLSKAQEFSIRKQMKEECEFLQKEVVVSTIVQILHKKSSYRTEKEWRILISEDNKNDNRLQFPFATAIYAGYQIEESKFERLKQVCTQKKITLYRQKLSFSSSSYEYEKVSL